MSRRRTPQIVVTVGVAALVAAACAVPAGFYRGKYLEEGITAGGPQLLVIGWTAFIFEPAVGLAWFANPAVATGLFRLWRGQFASAARWAAIAIGLGLIPLAGMVTDGQMTVRRWPNPALEFTFGGGEYVYAWAELRAGYFLWLAAHIFLTLTAATLWWRHRSDPAVDRPDPAPAPTGRSDLWPDEG